MFESDLAGGPSVPNAYLNADQRGGPDQINGKDNFSIDRAAVQMTGFTEIVQPDGSVFLKPSRGWSEEAGLPFTVSYAFRAGAPATMPDDATGFERFNAGQMYMAELAMRGWSDAANIGFVRVGTGTTGEEAYSNEASILFGNYTSGVAGASAFAFYPGDAKFSARSGDVWINSSIGYNANPSATNRGALVLTHEIGHAIGMAHPGDYDAGDEGGPITYAKDAEYYQDTTQYTVMSYFRESNSGADFAGRYPASPMLDDIAAIQVEYGANLTTRTGDTVYGFNSNAERPWFEATSASSRLIFAAWDAGGTDTFDFSGFTGDQLIDLREGFFSNVGGLIGNVAVAKGAVIENARGGTGGDQISGNAADNNLAGGAGADSLQGLAGRDYLRGDDGADIVYGNLGDDTLSGGTDGDLIRGGQGHDMLQGEEGDDWLSGDRGDDTVVGGAGADIFHGSQDAGIDRILDFSLAEGDRVALDPGTTFLLLQWDADTLLDFGGGHQMVLVGIQATSLTGGWLIGL